MPRMKITDEEFREQVMPLLLNGTPKIREIAAVTGLSEGGVYYKLTKLGIRLEKRFVARKVA